MRSRKCEEQQVEQTINAPKIHFLSRRRLQTTEIQMICYAFNLGVGHHWKLHLCKEIVDNEQKKISIL